MKKPLMAVLSVALSIAMVVPAFAVEQDMDEEMYETVLAEEVDSDEIAVLDSKDVTIEDEVEEVLLVEDVIDAVEEDITDEEDIIIEETITEEVFDLDIMESTEDDFVIDSDVSAEEKMEEIALLSEEAVAGEDGATSEDGDFEYHVNADGVSVTIDKYVGYEEAELRIPSKIEGKPVTVIGDGAFSGCSKLEGGDELIVDTKNNIPTKNVLIIPESVVTIGDNAFDGCSSIAIVMLTKGIKNIGSNAFKSCSDLDYLVLEGVTLDTDCILSDKYYHMDGTSIEKLEKGVTYNETLNKPRAPKCNHEATGTCVKCSKCGSTVVRNEFYDLNGNLEVRYFSVGERIVLPLFPGEEDVNGEKQAWYRIHEEGGEVKSETVVEHTKFFTHNGIGASTPGWPAETAHTKSDINKHYALYVYDYSPTSVSKGRSITVSDFANAKGIVYGYLAKDIVEIDPQSGAVKGLKEGEATVFVRVSDTKAYRVKINVGAATTGFVSAKIYTNIGAVVKSNFDKADLSGKVTYKSSNKSVATVDSKGKITAKGIGTAKITATFKNKKYTCTVKVYDPKISGKSSVKKGKSTTLTIKNGRGTTKWSTSNKKIATVDSNGKVKGKKKGTVTITAVNNGKTVKKKITVK